MRARRCDIFLIKEDTMWLQTHMIYRHSKATLRVTYFLILQRHKNLDPFRLPMHMVVAAVFYLSSIL